MELLNVFEVSSISVVNWSLSWKEVKTGSRSWSPNGLSDISNSRCSPIFSFTSIGSCFFALAESRNKFWNLLILVAASVEGTAFIGVWNSSFTSANYNPVMLLSSWGSIGSRLGERSPSDNKLSEFYSKYLLVPLRVKSSLEFSPKSLVKIWRC